MLIISNQLFDLVPSVLLVHSIPLRSVRRERHNRIDKHLTAIISVNTLREQLPSPVDQILANLLSETLICFLAESLHNLGNFKGTAPIDFLIDSLHQHCVETCIRPFWFQLV